MNARRLSIPIAGVAVAMLLASFAAATERWSSDRVAEAAPSMIMPFPHGQTWQITCDAGCHTSPPQDNDNALDFQRIPANQTAGQPVLAVAAGQVESTGNSDGNLGNYIKISHGGGYTTVYGHLQAAPLVTSGPVSQGQTIGYAGCTGLCFSQFGGLLHFALLHNGVSEVPSQMCSYTNFSGGQQFSNCDPTPPPTPTPPPNPDSHNRHDFNADGCADIIGRDRGDGSLYRYIGDCAGGFGPNGGSLVGNGWGVYDFLLAPGDLNADGCADVLGRNRDDGSLYRYDGNCSGGFGPNGGNLVGTGWGAYDFLIGPGDLNGDACADILGRNRDDGALYRYNGNCVGGFGPNGGILVGSGWGAYDFLIGPGDLNGDACADILGRNRDDGALYRYNGNCVGGFGPNGGIFVGHGWGAYDFLVGPGDLNSDGCVDILGRDRGNGSLYRYNGNCTGGFSPNGGILVGTGWGAYDLLASSCERPSGDFGDVCDPDDDNDAISDAVDNCPAIVNPTQLNTDAALIDHSPPFSMAVDDRTRPNSDNAGDACDADDDNDGFDETGGNCGFISNPLLADTDGDRYLDEAECALGTDALSASSKPTAMACATLFGWTLATDTDGDKIPNYIEFCHYNTRYNNSDTDGDKALDGAKDGCEAASFNGDRIVNVADMGMLATAIANVAFRVVSVDVNKDGVWNPADQGLVASFISPSGQCP